MLKALPIESQCEQNSDADNFQSNEMKIRTPNKWKQELKTRSDNSDVKNFFEMVNSMCSAKKYKKIKINVEFIDSD